MKAFMNRAILFSMAFLALPAAAHASAGEGHAQVVGGVEWADGESNATAGVAAGYDFDLGQRAFAGAEVAIDKVLVSGEKVSVALTGRGGLKLGEESKLYGLGGVAFHDGDSQGLIGGGFEHRFDKILASVEYRHATVTKANQVSLGLGVTF